MTYLRNRLSFRLGLLAFAFPVLFGACSEQDDLKPDPSPTAQYVATDVRYFLVLGDKIDTVTVVLKGGRVENPGSTQITQQVEAKFNELVKTSQFSLDPGISLPGDAALDKLNVKVPDGQWNGSEALNYFAEPFPLSATRQQKPYGQYEDRLLTVNVPQKSEIDIHRQIDAYTLTCSFSGVLENKSTGQRYPLKGKWMGLLRYNNLTVSLKQSPL